MTRKMSLMNRYTAVQSLLILFAIALLISPPVIFAESIEKLDPNMAVADPDGEWIWYDALLLGIEGKVWGETEKPYDRLPTKAEGVVTDSVWKLSKHSAGMAVHFVSDAEKISAKWEVTNDNLAMPHMPATGVSGLDLYVRLDKGWHWIGNGRPSQKETQAVLASGIPAGSHEYLLYLPLYNGTASLAIGVPKEASLAKAPARPEGKQKPLVFYGTSITHGGCASRPGMAYPAILGRRFDRPVVNLGFSGNGKMEAAMGELLQEIDAAAYILDCIPNMTPELIAERVVPLVKALRAARPGIPILLVENIQYQSGAFLEASRIAYEEKNEALQESYGTLLGSEYISDLYYLPGDTLLGSDGEATVDGVHPTDLGFQRMADAFEPVLKSFLSE
jgi:lysophospholipase L1-like esterase